MDLKKFRKIIKNVLLPITVLELIQNIEEATKKIIYNLKRNRNSSIINISYKIV